MFDLPSKLRKTREQFVSPLRDLFHRRRTLTAEDRDTIEEVLLASDMGVDACERILGDLAARDRLQDPREFLRGELMALLGSDTGPEPPRKYPRAIIVAGVNGVGKTTSIAKLASYQQQRGKKVILAAADTFRAAAVEQLETWARRLELDTVGHRAGGDPAAVAFDACSAARSRGLDYVIVDTAGRLHTRVNLMEELKKIKRACEKVLGPDSVETYLVLDATLGQNSLQQASEFTRHVDTTGVILTKLDSTARGGIVIAVKQTLGIPVRFIGVGEGLDDFAEFAAAEFVEALLAG
ncbi:MAG: signal recognition particle-docking protein FtsY [Candidatus Krumholzibacteriia bacterium]